MPAGKAGLLIVSLLVSFLCVVDGTLLWLCVCVYTLTTCNLVPTRRIYLDGLQAEAMEHVLWSGAPGLGPADRWHNGWLLLGGGKRPINDLLIRRYYFSNVIICCWPML